MKEYYEIEQRIFVQQKIFFHEATYYFGDKSEEKVKLDYHHVKNGSCKTIEKTYRDALLLARGRRDDGRYKNYEFLIHL